MNENQTNDQILENEQELVNENVETVEEVTAEEQNTQAEENTEAVEESPACEHIDFAGDMGAKPPKKTNAGIKLFVSLVALITVVCICVTAGYVVGKTRSFPINNNSAPAGVLSKPTDGKTLTASEVYQKVVKSVVGIIVYSMESDSYGTASGVVFKDGYILTNDHIYTSCPDAKFIIVDSEGNEYNASFVGGDTRSDVAVLKTDAKLPVAEFGNSNEVVVGEDAMAIGCPAGPYEDAIFTLGTISSTGRRVSAANTSYTAKMIQTDAAINPGNSGGALVNAYGQVIGITSLKSVGTSYDNVVYAIPSNTAIDVANKLIEYGYVKGRAVVGVSYVESSIVHEITMGIKKGLLIQGITEGGPLSGKGVEVGDVIIAINDYQVTSANQALDIIESFEAGDQITLTVYTTSDQTKTVTITLGEDKGGSSYQTTK